MKNNKALLLTISAGLCVFTTANAEEQNEHLTPNDHSFIYLDELIIKEDLIDGGILSKETIKKEEIVRKQSRISDTAKLLEDTSGISLQAGGGVSSIPVMRGLNDNRIKIDVNGMTVNSICPNHMNPPLANIDRSNIGSITVIKGITPVSMGGDSIAGTISVESPEPEFSEPGEALLITGRVSSFYRSNGDSYGGTIAAGLANENLRFDYTGSHTQSNNYEDGTGSNIKSTNYKNQNHAASLAMKFDSHLLEIKGGQQHIPFEGFPTARMDMTNNDSIFGNVHYQGFFDWGNLDGKLYIGRTNHTMNFGSDRDAPEPMPMKTRGKHHGFNLQAEIPFQQDDTFRFGSEFHSSKIKDYWPPTSLLPSMMGPETFINLNNAIRDRFGAFAEWERFWTDEWRTMLGLRYDHTTTDTGDAEPYNNITDDFEQAAAFNSLNHERNFSTFDVTALVQYTPNHWGSYSLGYARKNRAPSLHELYPWSTSPMPMTMIGWFGDGNGYVGNIDLRPETAHNIALTAEFIDHEQETWRLKISPYFSYVEDYIDADLCEECRQPTNGFFYLRMANHDAWLWGVDVTGTLKLSEDPSYGEFSTQTVMSYVRGRRTDGDNLYHMMPFNLKWSLNHKLGGWQSSFEMQFVDEKDDVQEIRNELRTSSYILLNAKTSYQWKFITVDVGLDNILDKQYFHPLSGVYIGDQNAMTLNSSRPKTTNLPGQGRSVYVGLTLSY
ncbi:TonB-dependent receptor [Methylohalobius crimeensis]|uniref:TonB-dependent receptor n=1 Tax=Methylohalobius crimeensis TaxID=244365 RepID=UPI0003B43CFA|nr:TonB-dependent receptor [Methylohalobius crimeensis]